MKRKIWVTLSVIAGGMMAHGNGANAQPPPCATITRANVVSCALTASLASKAEREALQAAEGKRVAARPALPANPILSLSAGRRLHRGAEPSTFDWYANLAQELEIGGQRGARRKTADAEALAQEQMLIAVDRDVAAQALTIYFEALAADDELRLAKLLEAMSVRVADAAAAASAKGIVSGIDADVAEAAMLRMAQQRISTDRKAKQAKSALLTLLGRDPNGELNVAGELEPLADAERLSAKLDAGAHDDRPEITALEAESRAFRAKADLLRRTRIPNPTFSIFAQNDGFNEKVLGIGVALPIPIPEPLGHTYAGEIQEADALGRRSSTQADHLRREFRGAVRTALDAYESSKEQSALYTRERTARATHGLQAIAGEIEAGRLAIRDAIVTQQALVEVLKASVDARKNLCLASLELARAAGIALERGVR